jgi:hypothetical protein
MTEPGEGIAVTTRGAVDDNPPKIDALDDPSCPEAER